MAFDAFEQFVDPGPNSPEVVGEDQAPPQVKPSQAEELPSDIREEAQDATAKGKP